MSITAFAKDYHEKMFPGYESDFLRTDPEFIERFDNFAFDEVINQDGQGLDDKTRWMAILATLIGCQGIEEYEKLVPAIKKASEATSAIVTKGIDLAMNLYN